ncbi:MAG: acetolactate decarboxylase [Candidatus Latescibacterota bacterium]
MKSFPFLWAVLLLVTFSGCCQPDRDEEVVFQTSTIDALLEGVYDGEITCGELRRHGDMGIGTFDALDGEMLLLDGSVYQIRADGFAYAVEDTTKTPFAAVTFFKTDREAELAEGLEYSALEEHLDSLLPTTNIFHAIRIEGTFSYVKTRSVPRQEKPYPPLVEVVKHQPTFEFSSVAGTMVGFRCPAYVKGINVPGYHLHFITADRKAGGHVLGCRIRKATVGIDHTSGFYMALPEARAFYETDLSRENQSALDQVEKEK